MNDSLYMPWLWLTLARTSGWLAIGSLGLALCVTPVARLGVRLDARWATHAPVLRRLIGMTSAWCALLHGSIGAFELYDPAHGGLRWLLDSPHLRAGLSALLISAALLATSFPAVVRALHVRGWKELHRLAYVAFAFAAQHVLLSPFAPRAWMLALASSVISIGLLRLLAARRVKPSEI